MPTWNHHTIKANGIDIHYVRHGPDQAGSALPIVLLHGWPEFWYVWHKIIPDLAQSFDVIAPDLRGFGDTETPKGVPRIQDYIRDLQGLLDELGIERAGLVSHDIGAYVTQGFSLAFSERVAGLFFFDCPYPGIGKRWVDDTQVNEIWYQSFHQLDWAPDLLRTSREATRLYFRHFLTHWAADPSAFGEDDLEIWVENFLKNGNLEGGFNWYKSSNDARMALIRHGAPSRPSVDTKSFFLWGAQDPILRIAWADRLGEYFSDYTLEPAENAGHYVAYERPQLAIDRIREFFAPIAES